MQELIRVTHLKLFRIITSSVLNNQCRVFMIALKTILLLFLFGTLSLSDDIEPRVTQITKENLKERSVTLPGPVRFFDGDIEGAHKPDFDDSDWQTWDSMWKNPNNPPENYTGVRWYRHYVEIDSTLFGYHATINATTFGASEVWFNGEKIFKNGKVSSELEHFEYGEVRKWVPVLFSQEQKQVIAVRFSNPDTDFLSKTFFFAGMNLALQDIKRSYKEHLDAFRFVTALQWLITGFCAVFAIIHFLFFLFNRNLRFNLWFALVCTLYAYASFVQQKFYYFSDLKTMIWMQITMQVSMVMAFAFLSLFLYSVLKLKTHLYFRILFGIAVFLCVLHLLSLTSLGFWGNINPFGVTMAFIMGLQIMFVSVKVIRSDIEGAWILGGGVLLFVLSVFLVLILEMSGYYITEIGYNIHHTPYLTFGIALVAMSVFQSRHLAKINLNLTQKLEEVKQLSDENLKKERSIREAEVERVRLETENERKTEELEKARRLQLSLLPKELPESEQFIVHAAMLTASEVGGDYYDVLLKKDGTQVWGIGDATGHGTEAGFVAAMTKTLFQSLAPTMKYDDCLREMSAKLKAAGLKKHFMCFGILALNKNIATWCSAGIPAAIQIRRKDNSVQFLESKGMPLGTVTGYPYQVNKVNFEPGDLVILLTDGLMEQKNAEREELGLDRIRECIQSLNSQTPDEIASTLMDLLNEWRGDVPQEDDVSIIVIKRQ